MASVFRRLLAPALVALAALAARGGFQAGIEAYPKLELIRNALDDQVLYDAWAKAILRGGELDWAGSGHEFAYWSRRWPGVFPQDPLYPYALAAFYRLAGFAYDRVRALQAALGVATALLVWALARRHLRPALAGAAALSAALYQPLVFYEATLLREPLATFLCAAALVSLSCAAAAQQRPRALVHAATAGAALGLAVVTRSHLALPTLALAGWLYASTRRRRGATATLVLAATAALVVVPVVVVNTVRSGSPAFVSSSGPYNLFIGNVPDGVGAGPTPRYFEVKAQGAPEDVDLVGAVLREAAAEPAAVLKLQAIKAARLFGAAEVPDNLNVAMGRETNVWLRLALVTDTTLVPAALVGLALALTCWRRHSLILVWVVAYAASVVPFIVVSRLRLPLLPTFAVLAALCADRVWELFQAGRRRTAAALAVAVALAVLAMHPGRAVHRQTDFQMAAAAYETRARLLEEEGAADAAARAYARAVVLNPDHLGAVEGAARLRPASEAVGNPLAAELCARGREAAAAGRYDEATRLLDEAARAAPEWALPYQYRANVHVLRGAPAAALPDLERAVARAPEDPRLRENLKALRRALGVVR
jgi:4-amino-4-deoxy-L-arabinose transferase-like glycosyltransferase